MSFTTERTNAEFADANARSSHEALVAIQAVLNQHNLNTGTDISTALGYIRKIRAAFNSADHNLDLLQAELANLETTSGVIAMGQVDASPTVYAPVLDGGDISVQIPLIAAGANVYSPTITSDTSGTLYANDSGGNPLDGFGTTLGSFLAFVLDDITTAKTIDYVAWYIDGTGASNLYRDNDEDAPYTMTYGNNPITVGGTFSGIDGSAGGRTDASGNSFTLGTGDHTITARIVHDDATSFDITATITVTTPAPPTGGTGSFEALVHESHNVARRILGQSDQTFDLSNVPSEVIARFDGIIDACRATQPWVPVRYSNGQPFNVPTQDAVYALDSGVLDLPDNTWLQRRRSDCLRIDGNTVLRVNGVLSEGPLDLNPSIHADDIQFGFGGAGYVKNAVFNTVGTRGEHGIHIIHGDGPIAPNNRGNTQVWPSDGKSPAGLGGQAVGAGRHVLEHGCAIGGFMPIRIQRGTLYQGRIDIRDWWCFMVDAFHANDDLSSLKRSSKDYHVIYRPDATNWSYVGDFEVNIVMPDGAIHRLAKGHNNGLAAYQ